MNLFKCSFRKRFQRILNKLKICQTQKLMIAANLKPQKLDKALFQAIYSPFSKLNSLQHLNELMFHQMLLDNFIFSFQILLLQHCPTRRVKECWKIIMRHSKRVEKERGKNSEHHSRKSTRGCTPAANYWAVLRHLHRVASQKQKNKNKQSRTHLCLAGGHSWRFSGSSGQRFFSLEG